MNNTPVLHVLWPYVQRHRRWLFQGFAAALIVVGARLALPWPLRLLTDIWTQQQAIPAALLEIGLSPALLLGIFFLLLLLLHGWADHIARLYFARLAIRTVRDLRKAIFQKTIQMEEESRTVKKGDLVARLLADTERIKTGLKSLLVHGATNGMIYAGVTVVLLLTNIWVGLLIGGAGLGTALLAWWGARKNREHALKHRTREGILANRILRALRDSPEPAHFGKVSKSSGRAEASITFTQGITSWGAHALFGLAVLLSLWIGTEGIIAGTLATGDMVLFILYVLLLRGPIIRLARQGSQLGNIVGTCLRLVHLLQDDNQKQELSLAHQSSSQSYISNPTPSMETP